MSQRAFKYFSITAGGTPQPLVGTTLTAALNAPTNPDTAVTATVADSSMFLAGDATRLESTGAATEERVRVFQVVDATHIQLVGVKFNHLSGIFVRLSISINSIYIQALDGNLGALYIGLSSAMVKATGVQVVAKLQLAGTGVQPFEFLSTRSGLANADDLGQLWIDGTTTDKYLPSVGQV
jgi:hypothetical protein